MSLEKIQGEGTVDLKTASTVHAPPSQETMSIASQKPALVGNARAVPCHRPVTPLSMQRVTSFGSTTPATVGDSYTNKSAFIRARPTVGFCSYEGVGSPMASIIRSGPHIQPVPATAGHVNHSSLAVTYSSHVPRGPAAVASITPPRAALAAPNVRPSHTSIVSTTSQQSITPNSAAIHPHLQARASAISTVRTLVPAVAKAVPNVLPQNITTEVLRTAPQSGANAIQATNTSAVLSDQVIRPGNVTKPVHISQSIMQSIQQMPEKHLYKQFNTPVTLASSSVASLQQTLPQSAQQVPSVVTSSSQPGSVTVTTPSHISTHSLMSSHASLQLLSQSQITSQLPNSNVVPHTTSTKLITQTMHTMSSLPSTATIASISSKPGLATNTSASTITATIPRQNATASIPVAKVHPQPIPVASRSSVEAVETVNLLLPSHRASPNHPPTGNSVTATVPTGLVLMETQQERSTAAPSAPYTIYYEPYQNNLTMSTYGTSTSSLTTVTTTSCVRPVNVSSHQTPTVAATVQAASRGTTSATLSPLMMTIDPNRPLALHASYATQSEGTSAQPDSSSSVNPGAQSGFTVTTPTQSSSTYGSTQSNINTPSSSPRPSILRKRTSDASSLFVKKNLLSSMVSCSEASTLHPDSGVNKISSTSPKPSRLEAQSSVDHCKPLARSVVESKATREGTITSFADSTNGIVAASVSGSLSSVGSASKEVKKEIADSSTSNVGVQNNFTAMEASPRKKPRKQQLTSNELMESHSTDEAEEEFDKDAKEEAKKEIVHEDADGVRWVVSRRRPPITLMNTYRHTWKSRHNHFLRYTDVRPKERPVTVHDLANQKGVLQKLHGWKVHHLCTQMDEVVNLEDNVHTRLAGFLIKMEDAMSKSDEDRDLNKVSELIKGNLQRCRIISDQMKEARQQILKVVDHKPQISEIVSKCISKRAIKKKEKS